MQELKFVWLKAVALSWKDATFKQKLLEEPRAALKSFLGVEVPEGVELRVREGSAEQAREGGFVQSLGKLMEIILPPPPAESRLQVVALSDYAQLALSGGGHPCRPCGLSVPCCC